MVLEYCVEMPCPARYAQRPQLGNAAAVSVSKLQRLQQLGRDFINLHTLYLDLQNAKMMDSRLPVLSFLDIGVQFWHLQVAISTTVIWAPPPLREVFGICRTSGLLAVSLSFSPVCLLKVLVGAGGPCLDPQPHKAKPEPQSPTLMS